MTCIGGTHFSRVFSSITLLLLHIYLQNAQPLRRLHGENKLVVPTFASAEGTALEL